MRSIITALVVLFLGIVSHESQAQSKSSNIAGMRVTEYSELSEEEIKKYNKGYEKQTERSRNAEALAALERIRLSLRSRKHSKQKRQNLYRNSEKEKIRIKAARQAGFDESQILPYLKHSICESGGWTSTASNTYRGGHFGAMQIQGNHYARRFLFGKQSELPMTYGQRIGAPTRRQFELAMFDEYKNAQIAYWLWKEDILNPKFGRRDGWGPWLETIRCRNSSTFKRVPWDQIITVYRYGINLD